MRKSEMNSLVAGLKIQSKKDSTVYEIVGIDLEQGKVILDNGKLYTMGTIQRWYSLYEEEIPEVVEPDNTILDDIEQADELTSEQDTTADTDTTTQDTTATTTTNTAVNEIHEDTEQTGQQDVVEGNTAINGQEIFENSISGIVIKHGCKLNRMKQYIAVRSNNVKGTLVYIRIAKEGGYHFDVGKTTWNKLDTDIQENLIVRYNACIKDRTRGLWRVSNCNSLPVFEKLLITALDIA